MADVLITIAGAALIAIGLRDIFLTLFQPAGAGELSRWVTRGVWILAHRLQRSPERAPGYAGPLGYVLAVAVWAATLVIGWALIYLPHIPEGFAFGTGLAPPEHGSFADAIYISLVNITSLGFGDIVPRDSGLRILSGTETIFGLGLLTASISWLISIHSALTRRETAARQVHLIREAEQRLGTPIVTADPELLERMLASVTEGVIGVRHDLIHLPILNLFQTATERQERKELRDFLREVVETARDERCPDALRVRAEILAMALEEFERTVEDQRPGKPAAQDPG